ncbi:hypothetical protein LJC08_03875 [Methanimicrococcus sp. OttesenSCG-928-J09]|nr:hypothetical protein [Methanimicrococcus sp. OttesenSCG-928-J09]
MHYSLQICFAAAWRALLLLTMLPSPTKLLASNTAANTKAVAAAGHYCHCFRYSCRLRASRTIF